MRLSQTQKQSLIRELYQLSTDAQLIPYLDEVTSHRINKILQTANSGQDSVDSLTPIKYRQAPSSMNKKKNKTQMQEIHEINHQYDKKFSHLFTTDEENDLNILKEIDIHLNSTMEKSNKKYNNFVQKADFNPSNILQLNSKNTKSSYSKTNAKKQNINSLMSTNSNLFHTKTTQQLATLKRKPSKQKLISYKIKTQASKYNYQIHTSASNKLVKKREQTLSKKILTGSQSRSNLQSIVKSPIKQKTANNSVIKRSQSQAAKFTANTNSASLNSTSKHQKLPLLRNSEQKNSLSTCNLKSASKKSISVLDTTTATKRQPMSLLPGIDFGNGSLRVQILKGEIESWNGMCVRRKDGKRSKSKSKQKNPDVGMKKGMKRSHTQCSVEKNYLRDDFLDQMRKDQELNFELTIKRKDNVKSKQKPVKQQQNQTNSRTVTETLPRSSQSEQQYFWDSSEEYQFDQNGKKQQNQQELDQGQPIPSIQQDKQAGDISETHKISSNQLIDGKEIGYGCLKRIMTEIGQQREQKLMKKVQYERQIAALKEKILHEKRALDSTLINNSKLQNELHSINSHLKSTSNERSLLSRCISQTRKVTVSLKHSISKSQQTHDKLISQELKEEQQLVEMYENVIDELKAEIKEQFRRKLEAKNELEVCHKRREGKLTKFNSTLLSSQKLKHNLTDAFKEWI